MLQVVDCNFRGDKLTASLLGVHLLNQHWLTEAATVDLMEPEERDSGTFVAHWPEGGKNLFCPVPGSVGRKSTS